ncbi:hypothetical protein KEM52_002466, partial [Ascosphaera acerosa]
MAREKEEAVQCQGLTRKRTQCTRKAPLSQQFEGRVLCWQHLKEAKGGESDSDDRAFIVDDEDGEEGDGYEVPPFDGSPSGRRRHRHSPEYAHEASSPRRRPQGPRPPSSSSSSSSSSRQRRPQSQSQSQLQSQTDRPPSASSSQHSRFSAASQHRASPARKPRKPLQKVSSTEELFDSFGRMNLVDDIPDDDPDDPAPKPGRKKEYSFFGGRMKVIKDVTGDGKHLSFAWKLREREAALRHKLFHRTAYDYDAAAAAGALAVDHTTYNGTRVPLTLPRSTADYLNWIPRHVSPDTAQKLLRELLVPVSPRDVPGYIYMRARSHSRSKRGWRWRWQYWCWWQQQHPRRQQQQQQQQQQQ